MAEHNIKGKEGEALARKLLRKKGYEILASNWRYGKKELDIVARHKDLLVVVEVKTRSNPYFETPKEAVTIRKQKNIIKAANAYIEENNINQETRFDIISVLFWNNRTEVEHIEDAFYPLV